MYEYSSCPSAVVEIIVSASKNCLFWYRECVASTSCFCFVFSKIKNMTLSPCMTATFIKADGSTHVLLSNWIMCYSMIHSDVPHCSMVYYETNETSSKSLHCMPLQKKRHWEKFKNGERMKRIIFIWTLAKIFCALFFFFVSSLPFFLYIWNCVQFSFGGHGSNR